MGLSVQMYSNWIKKVPISRQPWLHAFFFLSGCYVGNIYPGAEKALAARVNEKRAALGLQPMVGSNHWFKYENPEEMKKLATYRVP